ncbi:LLM class flavin-dependent oxidoreductase [Noviherbaspirillum sp.]|uniref:LLM class flavin-dependent oxidoreductase n=1 Tax=Noviherbaspirillum sp. TaxID=1926288 RepID=UPI002FE21D11
MIADSMMSELIARGERHDLATVQREIWFDQVMHGDIPMYNIGGYVHIEGAIDYGRFTEAFNLVFHKHDNLRLVLIEPGNAEGEPEQVILPAFRLDVPIHDFSYETDPHAAAVQWIQARLDTPFTLYRQLLFRCDLIKLSESRFYWSMHFHHLATDGWGIALLGRSMASIYSAMEAGEIPSLSAPQYVTYIQHDHGYRASDAYRRQRAYWLAKFEEVPEPLFAPRKHYGEGTDRQASDCLTFTLAREIYDRLTLYAEARRATTFQIILALLYVYAARISQKEDITIGIPVLNRSNAAFKDTFGLFASICPMRVALSPEMTFDQALARLSGILKQDYRYQRFPISEINRAVGLRHAERRQLFDICLSYESHDHAIAFGSARGHSVAMLNRYQQTPLTLFVREFNRSENIRLDFVFNTQYFDAASIVETHKRINVLIEAILKEEACSLNRLPLLTREEVAQLDTWNDTRVNFSAPDQVHQMFEAEVAVNGNAIAVISDEGRLTYRELNERANRLARHLVALGVGANSPVAVCIPRSNELLIGLLAVLKVGATYVPLDASYPAERIGFILQDSAPLAVLVHGKKTDPAYTAVQQSCAGEASGCTLVDVHRDAALWEHLSAANLELANLPPPDECIAYIIYTSGSTGKPKGVANTVAGLRNRLAWFHRKVAGTPLITAFKTSIGFVDSVTETLETITAGGSLVVFNHDSVRDPDAFAKRVSQFAVSNLVVVPSFLKHFTAIPADALDTVRTVVCSGERLAPDLVRAFRSAHPRARLFNFYGSSEANGDSTAFEFDAQTTQALGEGSIIGWPIANTCIYILDKWGQRLPVGVPGELYISGLGVGLGYLNQEERTAERFMIDPFRDRATRMYRTGDLARFRPDGSIEFLGRNDFQIKIRGFRIELGEVEKAIASHPDVKECVVVADRGVEDEYRLAAYVVPQAGQRNGDSPEGDGMAFSLFYFGAETYEQDDKYRLYIDSARFADQNGFHAVWTPERHFHEVGGLYPNPAILSAALATVTSRIQLRSGSVVLPLQDPIRVAEEWSVVDNLSGGRVGVSIASGWVPRDFVLAPDNYMRRKDVMATGIDALRSLWRGNPVEIPNGMGSMSEVRIYPKPVQSELPLWLTSSGNPATFMQAGALGANLLTHLLGQTIEEVAANIKVYRQALADHGHDPNRGRVTLMVHTYLGGDFDETLRKAQRPFTRYMRSHLGLLEAFAKGMGIATDSLAEKNVDTIVNYAFERYSRTASLIGTPQTCLEVVAQLRDAGVDEIACLMDWMDADQALQALPYLNELRQLVEKTPPSTGVMRKHLKRFLPDYMIPSSLTYLNHLPLTSSGKIDRSALPRPCLVAANRRYVAPRTETEIKLAEIYSKVLQLDTVGAQDRFFEIGGDSLLAVRLNNSIQQTFNVTLPIRDLFEHASLEELAEHLDLLASVQRQEEGAAPIGRRSLKPGAVTVRV